MRAYTTLRDMISNAGAKLVEEHLHPQSFGSAYAVFEGRNGSKFRFVWDGKESYGFIESDESADGGRDKGPIVRERFGSKFSNLEQFLALVDRY